MALRKILYSPLALARCCGTFVALMKEVRSYVRAALFVVAFSLTKAAFAVAAPASPSAEAIIEKAVTRVKEDERQHHPDYQLTKVTTREERNAQGLVKDRNHTAEQIIFRNGTFVKQNATSRNDATSIKFKNSSRSDFINLLTPDVIAKYNYRLAGKTNVCGRCAYEVCFQPKSKSLPAKDFTERILNQASGHLWIDADEYELVRAEVHVDSEVPVAGILGVLKRAAFSLERIRLEAGLWLERFYKTEYDARKLIENKHVVTQSEFKNFRKVAQCESSVTQQAE